MKKKIAFWLKVLAAKIEGGNATKAETARYTNATTILSNEKDSGRYGKAFELLDVSSKARKSEVAAQGKNDGYFNYNGSRHAVEYKSNGGRIESLYRLRKPENAFIIYTMDFETRQTYRKDGTPRPTKHYEVEPIILKVSDFLAILEHCNAVKVLEHKGKGDRERAVQGDSAKLAKVLADYPITWDPEYNYTAEDFEDLELF
jgi:hypothetical protein